MSVKRERSPMKRTLLLGFKAGLCVLVFDFFVVFGVPPIREHTLHVFSRLMEPVFLVAPLAFAVICLILFWILPDHHPRG